MKKILGKEFKIGCITIICGLILFFGIDYLKGINIFKPDNYYYVRYSNVTGLSNSAPVYIDGFKVGLIRNIEYDYSNPGNVVVEISLDKKLKVPAGSKAILSTDLLGTSSIDLRLNQYVGTHMQVADTLIGEIDHGVMGTLTQEMLPQFQKMMPQIDSILIGLNKIVNASQLQETFNNLNVLSQELASSSKELNKIMKSDLPVLVSDLKGISNNMNEISHKINKIDFDPIISSIENTLANTDKITKQMISTDNTIGLLLNNPDVYKNLNFTLQNADSLMLDLRKNPKRYVHFSVFGRK